MTRFNRRLDRATARTLTPAALIASIPATERPVWKKAFQVRIASNINNNLLTTNTFLLTPRGLLQPGTARGSLWRALGV